VGLVCRLLEERGIATTYVATGRDLTELVVPPRALFVNHPMGNNFGAPFDAATQLQVLRRALSLLSEVEVGGALVDMPIQWTAQFEFTPGAAASMG
jgi:hypothetical protein